MKTSPAFMSNPGKSSEREAVSGGDKRPSSAEEREEGLKCRQRIVKTLERRRQGRVKRPGLAEIVGHCSRGPCTAHYLTTGPQELSVPSTAALLKRRDVPGLRQRLRVVCPSPRKKESSPKTERAREKFVRKKYLDELRKRTMKNILTGYVKDEIKTIEEKAITAQFSLDQAQQEIDKASKSMAEFLFQEQKNCETLTKKLSETLEARKKRESQIEAEKKKMSDVKLRIFRQNEQLERMRMCREFVLNVAPDEWKKTYEQETEKRQDEVKDDIVKLKRALSNYKTHCSGDDPGLEKVLEDFIEEYSTAGPPSLPYDDPRRIFRLFKDLEMKSLRALHHNAELKKEVERLKKLSEHCDLFFEKEKESIDDTIEGIKKSIAAEKENVKEMKEVFKCMKKGPYKDMVASEEVLLEHVLIKNVYMELVERPREGLDTLGMLHEIGELYFELSRKLEGLSLKEKKTLEKKARERLERGMKEAERAERRKKQIENTVKGLRRAREKPWVKTGKPLMFKSVPVVGRTRVKEERRKARTGEVSAEEDLERMPSLRGGPETEVEPYRRQETEPQEADYKAYYPELRIEDTDEEEVLVSESEEEKEGKKKAEPSEEKKKVKRIKPQLVRDSSGSDSS